VKLEALEQRLAGRRLDRGHRARRRGRASAAPPSGGGAQRSSVTCGAAAQQTRPPPLTLDAAARFRTRAAAGPRPPRPALDDAGVPPRPCTRCRPRRSREPL